MTCVAILTDPNEILREKALEVDVDEITGTRVQSLIDDMIETMQTYDGIGIAGPQIGESERIFIGTLDGKMEVFINPLIKKTSFRKTNSEEGCLSVPDVWGLVKRHRSVTVVYYDREGRKQKRRLKNLEAIVFQHELDHLDGILFVDKIIKLTTTPKTL